MKCQDQKLYKVELSRIFKNYYMNVAFMFTTLSETKLRNYDVKMISEKNT